MFEEEIARGAAFLDEVRPGWERQIDIGTLELNACDQCVLGQVFGEEAERTAAIARKATETEDAVWFNLYDHTGFDWARVNLDVPDTASLGFSALGGRRDLMDNYHTLTDEWVAFIKDRFDSGQLSDANAN